MDLPRLYFSSIFSNPCQTIVFFSHFHLPCKVFFLKIGCLSFTLWKFHTCEQCILVISTFIYLLLPSWPPLLLFFQHQLTLFSAAYWAIWSDWLDLVSVTRASVSSCFPQGTSYLRCLFLYFFQLDLHFSTGFYIPTSPNHSHLLPNLRLSHLDSGFYLLLLIIFPIPSI